MDHCHVFTTFWRYGRWGRKKVADAAAKRTDYSDPGFLEAARKLRQLVDMGAFTADSATALREEAEALFHAGSGAYVS